MESLILILVGVIIVQGAFIMYSSHKFVNKFMSRSYHEYERAKAIEPKKEKNSVKLPIEEHSELGIL